MTFIQKDFTIAASICVLAVALVLVCIIAGAPQDRERGGDWTDADVSALDSRGGEVVYAADPLTDRPSVVVVQRDDRARMSGGMLVIEQADGSAVMLAEGSVRSVLANP
jgi:hypothetical protein